MKKILSILLLSILFSCQTAPVVDSSILTLGNNPVLPEPSTSIIPTVNIAKGSQWPDGVMPHVKDGFTINLYSKELIHPRWLYVLPNGDVLVAQSNKQSPKKMQD